MHKKFDFHTHVLKLILYACCFRYTPSDPRDTDTVSEFSCKSAAAKLYPHHNISHIILQYGI